MCAERLPAGEHGAHEALAGDHHARCRRLALAVGVAEVAAGNERNAERREVPRRDRIGCRVERLAGLSGGVNAISDRAPVYGVVQLKAAWRTPGDVRSFSRTSKKHGCDFAGV